PTWRGHHGRARHGHACRPAASCVVDGPQHHQKLRESIDRGLTRPMIAGAGMFTRLANIVRGFMSLFVKGIAKRNPEALLELEQENLRKQIGSYNQSLAAHAGLAERLRSQVRKLESEEADLRAKTRAHLR